MSLSKEEKYLISVLGAALKGKAAAPDSDGADIKTFCKLCADQCVAPFAYAALKDTGIDEKAEAFLKDHYEKAVLLYAKQGAEAERIFSAFSGGGIRFIPLKGVEVRSLYAHPECRTMSDIDIYIDESDFSRADKIMRDLGFLYRGRLSYQHQYVCGDVEVELHFALWGYDFEKIGGYETLFDFAVNVPGTSMYKLTNEYCYTFLIAHLAKHLKTSGIGARAFLDVYVYSLKFGKTMDWGRINRNLVEMGLDRFAVRLKELIGAWFYNKPFDENTETMTAYIMESYTHGTRKLEAAASLAGGTDKKERKKFLLFPPLSYMKRRYLILNRLPFLYPFCLVARLISAPFSKKSRASDDLKALDSLEGADVEKAERALSSFGLLGKDRSLSVGKDGNEVQKNDKPKIDFESEEAEEHRRKTLMFVAVSLIMLVGASLLFYFTFFVKNESNVNGEMSKSTAKISETAPTDSGIMSGETDPNGSVYEVFPYKNGVYSGWSVDGVPNGSGELRFTNEDKYIGNFKDGEFNGNGKLYTGGDIYEGEFKNGILDGIAAVYYGSGNVYEGEYKNGEQTGKGKYTWSNGDFYEGDFVSGIREGQGKYTWVKNGKQYAVYEGEWQNNTQSGFGKYSDGSISYEGEYLDGVFNGRGVYTWSEGVYTGKFVYGEQNDSKAVIEYKSGGKFKGKYEGPVVNGVIEGYGTYTMSNGDIIKGTFVNALLEGEAQYYYAATKKWVKVKYANGKIVDA